jgi:hypothetical protein
MVEAKTRAGVKVRPAIDEVAYKLNAGHAAVKAARAACRRELAKLTDAEISALADASPDDPSE